ncbi:CHRD domain-containing protein [Aliifodinibius salicampi]|uniref:CHRD domain-containing protein n=1 Tax=Fodinibius salicampi TaxID=1920655 RepID=A0ABT3Q085_9BACT|nr:CHRD domain-containing protein [Fodinibius salicampi]MCW9713542.1 CHRD domain-containing protein [Fodinibius salicampi]
MKKKRGWFIGLFAIVFVVGYACADQPLDSPSSGPEQTANLQQIEGKAHASANHDQLNFRTHLQGNNEVPAVETNAQGQATFKMSKDGSSISYKLIVSNIENVLMAHIHNAPAGENGGVVVWLYPASPPPALIEGQFQGVLAEGTITADNLVGSLAGQTLDDLIEEIKAGNTYVNVHTTQVPSGEIRGQIH